MCKRADIIIAQTTSAAVSPSEGEGGRFIRLMSEGNMKITPFCRYIKEGRGSQTTLKDPVLVFGLKQIQVPIA